MNTEKNSDDALNNEANSEQAATDEAASSEERIAQLEEQNRQLREQTLRALADLENVRRRSQQERSQLIEFANEGLLQRLLPIVDDFQRSVDAGAQSRDFDNFYQGVQMVHYKLLKLLEAQGVRAIEAVGQPFNVDLHDAMMRQPSEAPEGTIITELEPGYMYGDKVLRHAKVIVSAGS